MNDHLQAGAPALGQCLFCGRKTWAKSEVGRRCGMPQPDGTICGGHVGTLDGKIVLLPHAEPS